MSAAIASSIPLIGARSSETEDMPQLYPIRGNPSAYVVRSGRREPPGMFVRYALLGSPCPDGSLYALPNNHGQRSRRALPLRIDDPPGPALRIRPPYRRGVA